MGPKPQCYIPRPKVIGPLVLEKKIFEGFLPYMGWPSWSCVPDPWRIHMKFGFDWPSGFGEEDLWKWWTDGRQRMDDWACLYYKLTNEPKGSGELKNQNFADGQIDGWITWKQYDPHSPHPQQTVFAGGINIQPSNYSTSSWQWRLSLPCIISAVHLTFPLFPENRKSIPSFLSGKNF